MSEERQSHHDLDENTGIHAIATKLLLENLLTEVKEMRGELAEVSGIVLTTKQQQNEMSDRMRELAVKLLDHERRMGEIEQNLRAHQLLDTTWQSKHASDLNLVTNQISLVAPLTARHEEFLQRAHGAVMLSRSLWVVLGLILGGGGLEVLKLLSGH